MKKLAYIGYIFCRCSPKICETWLVRRLVRDENFFTLNAPTITTHRPTFSNDTVARNKITDVIFPDGTRNSSHGIGLFDEKLAMS